MTLYWVSECVCAGEMDAMNTCIMSLIWSFPAGFTAAHLSFFLRGSMESLYPLNSDSIHWINPISKGTSYEYGNFLWIHM